MAVYNSYVSIPHSTYAEWKSNTLGNSYDVDGIPAQQPYQCWDYVSEFWWNAGFPTGYPITGGNDAKGIWWNRNTNKGDKFNLVYSLDDLQVGDVICFSYSAYGHVGFVDEVYDGSGRIKILSQNVSHDYVTVESFGTASFQGAFRYIPWNGTPPTPPTPVHTRKGKFPWVLYARKLRERR